VIALEQLAEEARKAKELRELAEREETLALCALRDSPLTPGILQRYRSAESYLEACERLHYSILLKYFEASEAARRAVR
jgi:hypothetical protein